jgi:flagellar motor protein MotB
VFETSNARVSPSNTESVPFSQVQAVENIERTSDMQRFVQPMKGIVSPAAAAGLLKDMQAELEKALAPEIRSRVVDIKARKEGLVVSLREVGFCESGASTTPSCLSAAGYAEFHPVADNNSTDGRVRNRRVDIVILNPTSSGLIPPPLSSPQATSSSPVSAPKTASSPNNLPALNRLAPLCDGFP